MWRLSALGISSLLFAGSVQWNFASSIRITQFNASGFLKWTNNASLAGHYRIEVAPMQTGEWSALPGFSSLVSTQTEIAVTVPVTQTNGALYRVVWTDPPLADSYGDYGTTQGENGWFYGYYDQTGNFALLHYGRFVNTFSVASTNWNFDGTNSWLLLDQSGGHPEGTNCARMNAAFPVVRRWISTVEGTVQFSARLKDLDIGGGNGVSGSLIVDGITVAARDISDGGDTNFTAVAALNVGSTVDCVLDARSGNECYDYSLFRVTIRP